MHVKKGKNNTPAGRLYSISSNIRVKTYNCKAQSAHTHNRERKRIKIRQITLGLSVFPKIELHVEYFNAKSQNVSFSWDPTTKRRGSNFKDLSLGPEFDLQSAWPWKLHFRNSFLSSSMGPGLFPTKGQDLPRWSGISIGGLILPSASLPRKPKFYGP